MERIVLAHGGGGEMTARLVRERIAPMLSNPILDRFEDSAIVPWRGGDVIFTTDSFVVSPLEFPGGDIGRIAVAGTVNDLAVMGARPIALSLGMIIEEGLPIAVLDRIIASIAATAAEAGVRIVTGDTKVLERRSGDGMYINTSGLGELTPERPKLAADQVCPGDAVIVNGPIAEHGLAIMSLRAGMEFDSHMRSDAAPLNRLIGRVLECGATVRFMRDATRGGLAGVLADVSEASGASIIVDESDIPITPTAQRAADLLGLDPLTIANEGKVVCFVPMEEAALVVSAMRMWPEGRHAAVIGRVTDEHPALVELITRSGGRRIVQRPYGEELPRIC
ncbi:MAG: hydrogenase expression/formation protein HypE [Phycisphaerae bacterium]|nr:hydrogenase expression/formation protein HypE [Phycisphaerae bacterium]